MQFIFTDDPTWIIDPIDGTMNFVHSNPLISISVALTINKCLEIGIIYLPALNMMYTARKGKGAELNGKKISVNSLIFLYFVEHCFPLIKPTALTNENCHIKGMFLYPSIITVHVLS